MLDMFVKSVETTVNLHAFPLLPLEESYFFCVAEKLCVQCAVFTLQLLFTCG